MIERALLPTAITVHAASEAKEDLWAKHSFSVGFMEILSLQPFRPNMPNMLGTGTQRFNIFCGGVLSARLGKSLARLPAPPVDDFHSVSLLAFVLTNNRIGHQVSIGSTPKAGHWLRWTRLRLHCRSHSSRLVASGGWQVAQSVNNK